MPPTPLSVTSHRIAIPRIGLGVFRAAAGDETRAAVGSALRCGYRHIDTAAIYGNEADVGSAIRDSGIARDEIFVCTKLWNGQQGYDAALRAYDESLARLGLDYADLYLVHWPLPGKRLESWRALEYLYEQGRVRAIGVSNFLDRHLLELFAHARIAPMVNQIEVSPFLQRRSTRALCASNDTIVEAYSPLTKGQRLNHPVVTDIAQHLGRTPAQILIRWGIEHDMVVLPKSTRPERIAANIDVFDFELGPHRTRLDALEDGLVTGWDPATVA